MILKIDFRKNSSDLESVYYYGIKEVIKNKFNRFIYKYNHDIINGHNLYKTDKDVKNNNPYTKAKEIFLTDHEKEYPDESFFVNSIEIIFNNDEKIRIAYALNITAYLLNYDGKTIDRI